jgi:hypothetical protein
VDEPQPRVNDFCNDARTVENTQVVIVVVEGVTAALCGQA